MLIDDIELRYLWFKNGSVNKTQNLLQFRGTADHFRMIQICMKELKENRVFVCDEMM